MNSDIFDAEMDEGSTSAFLKPSEEGDASASPSAPSSTSKSSNGRSSSSTPKSSTTPTAKKKKQSVLSPGQKSIASMFAAVPKSKRKKMDEEEEEGEERDKSGGNAEKRAKIGDKAADGQVTLKSEDAAPMADALADEIAKDESSKVKSEKEDVKSDEAKSSTEQEAGFRPPTVVAAPKKVDKAPPKRCSECRAILDNNPNLKIRENEPVEAVEEVIALTDPRLAVEGMDCEDRPTVLVTSYR